MTITHCVDIDVELSFALDLFKDGKYDYKLTKIVENPDPEALGTDEMYFFALECKDDKKGTRKHIEFAFNTLTKAKKIRKMFKAK